MPDGRGFNSRIGAIQLAPIVALKLLAWTSLEGDVLVKIADLAIVAAILAAPVVAHAETRYVAKVVCGKASGDVVRSYSHSPGVYYTTLTLMNVSGEAKLAGTLRFAIAVPALKPAKATPSIEWTLEPGTARQVSCGDVYKQLGVDPGAFMEGFVHLVSDSAALEVGAVYSLFDGNYPASIDVEHINPR